MGEQESHMIRVINRRARRTSWQQGVYLLGVIVGLLLLSGLTQPGPRRLADVPRMMPGVPLFPLATLAPDDLPSHFAMAPSLHLMEMQGAKRAVAVHLRVPAEQVYIRDWYRTVAPAQRWQLLGEYDALMTHRLIYLRDREGMQVGIGRTAGLYSPVQIIYLQGMTNAQLKHIAPQYVANSPEVIYYQPLPSPDMTMPDLHNVDAYQPFRQMKDVFLAPTR